MKKILLFPALIFSLMLTAQNQKDYLSIEYSSICCGTPPSQPVLNVLKEFQQKNKLPAFELLIARWGYEGEYNLYIGIDKLNSEQIKELKKILAKEIKQQNKMRNDRRDGEVKMQDKIITGKELRKKQQIQKYEYQKDE